GDGRSHPADGSPCGAKRQRAGAERTFHRSARGRSCRARRCDPSRAAVDGWTTERRRSAPRALALDVLSLSRPLHDRSERVPRADGRKAVTVPSVVVIAVQLVLPLALGVPVLMSKKLAAELSSEKRKARKARREEKKDAAKPLDAKKLAPLRCPACGAP